ncbi:MAG: ParB/RepB/Spo0J family partition protein [Nitrospirae bacterium]|nr:ParB/RepB/Spo0J family partition protein [Nitrospirota bacterium]
MIKKALGRGLSTLIPQTENVHAEGGVSISEIEISRIVPNKYQPRHVFEDGRLEELANSISVNGVIQPVIVRHLDNGVYELIAGERRWRAARIAGLKKIPVVVKDLSNEKSLEIALIENLQRENLNPIEAALGYQRLLNEFNLTQEDVAVRIGKERSTVANYLRLLGLPEKVKEYLSASVLSPGHAKAILSLASAAEQTKFAEHLVSKGASVREAEIWAKDWGVQKKKKKVMEKKDSSLKEVETRFQRVFSTKVRIQEEKKGGKIVVEYYSVDDLNRILEIVEG